MITLSYDRFHKSRLARGPRVLHAPHSRLLYLVARFFRKTDGDFWFNVVACGVFPVLFSVIGICVLRSTMFEGHVSMTDIVVGVPAIVVAALPIIAWLVVLPLSFVWLVCRSTRYEDGTLKQVLSNIYDSWQALPDKKVRRAVEPLLKQARASADAYVLSQSRVHLDGLWSRSTAMRELLAETCRVKAEQIPLGDEDLQAVQGLTAALKELHELREPKPTLTEQQVDAVTDAPRLADQWVRRRM